MSRKAGTPTLWTREKTRVAQHSLHLAKSSRTSNRPRWCFAWFSAVTGRLRLAHDHAVAQRANQRFPANTSINRLFHLGSRRSQDAAFLAALAQGKCRVDSGSASISSRVVTTWTHFGATLYTITGVRFSASSALWERPRSFYNTLLLFAPLQRRVMRSHLALSGIIDRVCDARDNTRNRTRKCCSNGHESEQNDAQTKIVKKWSRQSLGSGGVNDVSFTRVQYCNNFSNDTTSTIRAWLGDPHSRPNSMSYVAIRLATSQHTKTATRYPQ